MDNAKTVLRNCQWVDQPPAEPPKKRKRLVTAKMREANKSNSVKSTGAKTEAGRATSRMNSTRHGAASQTIMFLPGENEQDFWDELDLWIRQRDAKTAEEKACVQSAVYSRWTWRRAINSQAHAVTAAITRIENHFDEAKAAEVRELRKELVSNPDIIVTQLMNSTCGCAFLINELTALSLRLKTHYFLEVSQREHALRLAGHCPNELFTDWVVREFNRSYFGSIRGPGGFTAAQVANALIYDRPSDISEGEYERRLEPLTLDLPSIEDGHAQLKKYLADWISRLTERKELMGYREADQKKAAIGEAQTEVSREGQTRARLHRPERSDAVRRAADGADPAGGSAEAWRPGPGRADAGGRGGGGPGRRRESGPRNDLRRRGIGPRDGGDSGRRRANAERSRDDASRWPGSR